MKAYAVSGAERKFSTENTTAPCTNHQRATHRRAPSRSITSVVMAFVTQEWRDVRSISAAVNMGRAEPFSMGCIGQALKLLADRHIIMRRRERVRAGAENTRLVALYRLAPLQMEKAA